MMFFLIFALWLIFNGRVTLEVCIFGVVISAALYWFCCKYLGYGKKRYKHPFRRMLYYLEYFGVLVVEIIKANIEVLGMAMAKELDFEPRLIYFKTDLKETSSRVLLANSITLTPGTITVTLEDDLYCVHCLDEHLADGIEDSSFVQLLRKIEEVS